MHGLGNSELPHDARLLTVPPSVTWQCQHSIPPPFVHPCLHTPITHKRKQHRRGPLFLRCHGSNAPAAQPGSTDCPSAVLLHAVYSELESWGQSVNCLSLVFDSRCMSLEDSCDIRLLAIKRSHHKQAMPAEFLSRRDPSIGLRA